MGFGQFFSQRFGYAVHALAYVAKKPPGALTQFSELARWIRSIWPQASETYLSNVVQRMARGGLLRSHRGVAGGYSLARDPNEMTLLDVARLLEGVDVARCSLSLEGDCPAQAGCSIQDKLRKIEQDYLRLLESVTVAELAEAVPAPTPLSPPGGGARTDGRPAGGGSDAGRQLAEQRLGGEAAPAGGDEP